MMLTRRDFHLRLMAGIAALGLPRPALASDSRSDLWLNRLSFGATPDSRDAVRLMGQMGWLEDQLQRPVGDAGLATLLRDARLQISYDAGRDENGHSWPSTDDLRPLDSLTADPTDQMHCIDWSQGLDFSERVRPAMEVISASLIRAVHAPAQLREVMTQFWHDHFSVNALKNEFTAAFFPSHDALLRDHAFGNFRVLLGDVARSPAMLYYLNNDESRAAPANENFARELLELHTLGAASYLNDRYADWASVPGAADGRAEGYLDLDVYEVARAFTGWSVGDGRGLSEGSNAPRTGRFHYVEAWHDPYQKRVLGVEFPPNRAPMADGDQVLDLLARHSGTARHICTKLARRLLTDDPPAALVDRLAGVFLAAADAPDQMAQVIRTLVSSPEFTDTPPQKLRRPFEVLAALYRATGAEVTGTENDFHWQLMRAGWRQHQYGPPTGHPDVLAAWTGASSLNRIVDLALYAHDDWFAVATLNLAALEGADETLGQFLARRSVGFGAEPEPEPVLAALGLDAAQPAAALSQEERHGLAAAAIAFAALTPEFLLR